jgi:hypothetical protein
LRNGAVSAKGAVEIPGSQAMGEGDRPERPKRDERLRAALRANLGRRKAQARERKAQAPGEGEPPAPPAAAPRKER